MGRRYYKKTPKPQTARQPRKDLSRPYLFIIKESPLGGLGAFAHEFIPKGTLILGLEYDGRLMAWDTAQQIKDAGGDCRHILQLMNGTFAVDGSVIKFTVTYDPLAAGQKPGKGAVVNMSNTGKGNVTFQRRKKDGWRYWQRDLLTKRRCSNTRTNPFRNQATELACNEYYGFRALDDIHPGEEILVFDYGPGYDWQDTDPYAPAKSEYYDLDDKTETDIKNEFPQKQEPGAPSSHDDELPPKEKPACLDDGDLLFQDDGNHQTREDAPAPHYNDDPFSDESDEDDLSDGDPLSDESDEDDLPDDDQASGSASDDGSSVSDELLNATYSPWTAPNWSTDAPGGSVLASPPKDSVKSAHPYGIDHFLAGNPFVEPLELGFSFERIVHSFLAD